MRSTIVPAQITTVEDRIAGSLGVSQILLLTAPIFGGSIVFAALPPFIGYAAYKVVVVVCLAALCGVLAIRIKGNILLHWAIIILRFRLRPTYYVFNKNDANTRDSDYTPVHEAADDEAKEETAAPAARPQLSIAEMARVEALMADPQANLYFTTNRKGALSVHITET